MFIIHIFVPHALRKFKSKIENKRRTGDFINYFLEYDVIIHINPDLQPVINLELGGYCR